MPRLQSLKSICVVRTRAHVPLKDQFMKFHRENPNVYWELRNLALAVKRKGHKFYSIQGLFEVLRFDRAINTTGDTFKLSNNWKAFYARMLMNNVPQLKNFFMLRATRHNS